MHIHNKHRKPSRTGLTLVELLVVITIMTILAALLVPQLRTVNKERNIREAARLVASTFANASQRAINEGIAGVQIVRNQNLIDADGVNFAGTSLYVMRQQPAYTGDDGAAEATWLSADEVTIPMPFEQEDLQIVRAGDYVSFNYSAVRYRILMVTLPMPVVPGDPMTLQVEIGGSQPPLPGGTAGDTFPFVIHRQPQRLESSRVDLPEGYLIDLRFSGELNFGPDASLPFDPRTNFHEIDTNNVTYLFNSKGGIERYYYTQNSALPLLSQIPTTTQYLLVREYSPDEVAYADVLNEPDNLWVTVNPVSGAANVAYVVPTDSSVAIALRLANSRGIAQGGQSANQ